MKGWRLIGRVGPDRFVVCDEWPGDREIVGFSVGPDGSGWRGTAARLEDVRGHHLSWNYGTVTSGDYVWLATALGESAIR